MLFGEFAKSQAEAEYPELWQGLVGAWSPCLSPRGGTVLRDLSGRQNHGVLTNMDPATEWVVSQGRQALDFASGGDDYVDCGNVAIGGLSTLTLVVHCMPTSMATDYATLVSKYSSGTSRVELSQGGTGLNGTSALLAIVGNGANSYGYSSSGVFAANTRAQVAMVFDGTKATNATRLVAYKNGVEVALTYASTIPATIPTNVATLKIGRESLANYPFAGLIWDCRLYAAALSQSIFEFDFRLGPGGWATPRRRRWNYATAQTAIPYWVFARKNARLIGGGVT